MKYLKTMLVDSCGVLSQCATHAQILVFVHFYLHVAPLNKVGARIHTGQNEKAKPSWRVFSRKNIAFVVVTDWRAAKFEWLFDFNQEIGLKAARFEWYWTIFHNLLSEAAILKDRRWFAYMKCDFSRVNWTDDYRTWQNVCEAVQRSFDWPFVGEFYNQWQCQWMKRRQVKSILLCNCGWRFVQRSNLLQS